MNKFAYFGANIVAIIICLALIILGATVAKIFGAFGLIYIVKEFVTGKYKKYIN